ncbi:MAG: HIT family protein [Bacteroidetes bacterium]|nr:MAG: HIT family protein [Bacteroidota bacterium]
MPSIFTRIVQGEIPCYRVAETEDFLAFLDINPRREGHTLVIPKQEVDYIFDLEEPLYTGLHRFAKQVAKAIETVVSCKRIGVAVIGLEVPHVHIHLIPIESVGDINFSRPAAQFTAEEFANLAQRIAAAYQARL